MKKSMNVFTDKPEESNQLDWKEEILRNISLSGSVEKKVNPIIANQKTNITHILNLSSGLPRLQTNIVKRFNLILSQPQALDILNPSEIRCCLCRRVVSYPAWYYSIKYAVNHFHYFVCFDASSKDKPNTKCYRREV